MLLNDFSQAMIIGLFGVLVGLIFYVLRTSGGREEKLTSLLECYSEQLSRLTRQLDEVSHNVADISRLVGNGDDAWRGIGDGASAK